MGRDVMPHYEPEYKPYFGTFDFEKLSDPTEMLEQRRIEREARAARYKTVKKKEEAEKLLLDNQEKELAQASPVDYLGIPLV